MLKKILIISIACFVIATPGFIRADDTEIFGGVVNVEPNVLIVFDNSGSMADQITVPGWQPMAAYSPGTTYSGTYTSNMVYYKSGQSWVQWKTLTEFNDICDNSSTLCSCSGITNCTLDPACATNSSTAKANINTGVGYINNLHLNLNSTYFCATTTGTINGTCKTYDKHGRCTSYNTITTTTISPPSTTYSIALGNYLNYNAANQANNNVEYDTKIHIAQKTICDLIDATPGVRFGLMTFNPSGTQDHGGVLVASCKSWTDSTSVTDTNSKAYLKNKINSLTAQTWTPLAETLAEAGLYFAGKPSWSNANTTANYNNYNSAYPSDYTGLSPIQYKCQKNFVIIMTDGDSTHDYGTASYQYTRPSPSILTGTYLNGHSIGDYDASGQDETSQYKDSSGTHSISQSSSASGSDYLDDVAKFLYDQDLVPSTTTDQDGNQFDGTQNITTYTIGFNPADISAFGLSLLQRAADNTHGHGTFYTTSTDSSLQTVFQSIITNILATNSQFISPVVPVNRMNKTYADNGIYLGIFKPDSNYPGLWKGNLKKFGFLNGEILTIDSPPNNIATDSNGAIRDDALSAWVPGIAGNDGMQVDKGGVGTVLMDSALQPSRTFWTYKYATSGPGTKISFTTTDLNNSSSTFWSSCPFLQSDLGLSTTTERDDLLKFITATGLYNPSGTDAKKRPWVLGDIVHSQPAIMYDKSNGHNNNLIFVGANDGFLHCFVDNDYGTSAVLTDDRVTEQWAFAPWDLLPNLQYLPSTNSGTVVPGNTDHDYFVDGSPAVYQATDSNIYIAFGLRRGGKNISTGADLAHQYFILNFNKTDYSSSLAASISTSIIGATAEQLGQSWATPHYCKIRTGTNTSNLPIYQEALLLAGGYDTNQDKLDPGSSDTKGRAIFAVNPTSGALLSSLFNYNHGYYPNNKMRYSMVDFMAYDNDFDGCDDTIYAPSVGGDLFAFRNIKQSGGSYAWSNRLLFTASSSDTTHPTSTLRKFLYAPGVVEELINGVVGDWVYIGSGDREDPSNTTITNRFYAIKNTWPASPDDTTVASSTNPNGYITDSNLVDLTDDELQDSSTTAAQRQAILDQITSSSGWYIDLENSGEKVVSTPLIYNKVIYFTTFSPSSDTSATDHCLVGVGAGTARIYAINYLTGEAVFAGLHNGVANVDNSGNTKPTKQDRSVSLGSGIPSEPTLVITQGDGGGGGNDPCGGSGAYVLVGTQQGTAAVNTCDQQSLKRFYWLKN